MAALPKLAAPAQRALAAAGLARLEDVATWRRDDIAALHGIGKGALERLDAALAEAGLGYAG